MAAWLCSGSGSLSAVSIISGMRVVQVQGEWSVVGCVSGRTLFGNDLPVRSPSSKKVHYVGAVLSATLPDVLVGCWLRKTVTL